MRLICPNCDAQYDIADDVIPEGGLDVQCSSCGHTWFHEKSVDIEEPFQNAPQTRAPLDSSVADILRQEAEHEQRAREAPAAAQPEMAADTAGMTTDQKRAEETRQRIAVMKQQESTPAALAAASTGAVAGKTSGGLPNIDEINATLRARAEYTNASGLNEREEYAASKRRGFRRGFAWVLILLALAAVPYLFADEIIAYLPNSADYINQYVVMVNEGRIWLDAQTKSLIEMGKGFIADMTAPDPAVPDAEAAAAEN